MNSNSTTVDGPTENNDKEIKALTELPDILANCFFNRKSPVIAIPTRNCASPHKLAYSLGDDKPSILGNDFNLNTRHTSCIALSTTRHLLSKHLTNLPTLQQIFIQKNLNSEINQVYHSFQDSDSETEPSFGFESEEDISPDLNF